MSGSSIPKAVLSSPHKEDYDDQYDNTNDAMRSARFYEIVMTNVQQSLQDMHQARMKFLRKELDYLKENEWKYDPIDKYIGQASHYTR